MYHYRNPAPGRTPSPDVVSSHRGAHPAKPASSNAHVAGSSRGALSYVGSISPPDIGHLQRSQRAAAPYPALPPNPHEAQHASLQRPESSSRYQPAHHPAASSPLQRPHPEAHYTHRVVAPRSPPRPKSPDIHPNPNFIIVGLFALRLTLRLISRLDPYPQRGSDMAWLETFLAPYSPEYALAKISGAKREEYVVNYREIVCRMKKQARYPIVFMGMNPDRRQAMRGRDGGRDAKGRTMEEKEREMTDLERLDIIDFCDAAGEWGSVVPIPAKEADRMIELAEQRKVADLEEGMAMRDERYIYER